MAAAEGPIWARNRFVCACFGARIIIARETGGGGLLRAACALASSHILSGDALVLPKASCQERDGERVSPLPFTGELLKQRRRAQDPSSFMSGRARAHQSFARAELILVRRTLAHRKHDRLPYVSRSSLPIALRCVALLGALFKLAPARSRDKVPTCAHPPTASWLACRGRRW